MPNLPNKNECCGCAACVDACNKSAITLKEDENSFYYPSVDSSLCIDCKLCEKKCHILQKNAIERNDARNVQPLVGWSISKELLKNSATGAIFAQLAYDFLGMPNTYVYGAAMEDNNDVRHIEISSRDELIKLQNSKYKQSVGTGIFKKVKERLQQGATVFFSGVPCQIAALYVYLGKLKDSPNLFTLEILCHGVPTNELSRVFVKKENIDKIIRYRSKPEGWLFGETNRPVVILNDKSIKLFKRQSFIYRSYLFFHYCRPNCYECKYANVNRVADITVGDFWGIRQADKVDELCNYYGVSIILENSEKGKRLINENKSIITHDISWKEILPTNQNLFMPTNMCLYHGGKYIHLLRHLPFWLQVLIYQHGPDNPHISRLVLMLTKLLQSKRNNKIEARVTQVLNSVYNYLEIK